MNIIEFIFLPTETIRNLQSIDLDCIGLNGDRKPPSFLDDLQFISFCNTIERCIQVQSINFSRACLGNLTVPRFKALCDALSHCTQLQWIDFSENNLAFLEGPSNQALCTLLETLPQLESINLGINHFSDSNDHVQLFSSAIRHNIPPIDTSANPLHSLQSLFNILPNCKKLKSIGLNAFFLGGLDLPKFQAVCNGLKRCINLQHIGLNNNYLNDLDEARFLILLTVLESLPQLRMINLEHNNLRNLDITRFQRLFSTLSRLPQLQRIELGDTNYTPAQFEVVYNALSQSKTLRTISTTDFSSEQMGRLLYLYERNDPQRLDKYLALTGIPCRESTTGPVELTRIDEKVRKNMMRFLYPAMAKADLENPGGSVSSKIEESLKHVYTNRPQ